MMKFILFTICFLHTYSLLAIPKKPIKVFSHPIRQIRFWDLPSQQSDQLVRPAGTAMIEYLNSYSRLNGHTDKIKSIPISSPGYKLVLKAFEQIPTKVKDLVRGKFLGIFLVKGLQTTGFAEYVQNARGRPMGGFIVLDWSKIVGKSANDFASWKESLPFEDTLGEYRFKVKLEKDQDNNTTSAIRYILIHELGHLISVGRGFHPSWWSHPKYFTNSTTSFPFTRLSWTTNVEKDRYQLKDEFQKEANVGFYRGKKLSAKLIEVVYKSMKVTPFPTLYSMQNPFEDWADAFANYVHTQILKRPFRVEIFKKGKLIHSASQCWNETRCFPKKKMLDRFLKTI
ncbi:MAG: hypothetical protein HOE90_04540 [Bacteriovoracaceae bacterium]|jgi:hypothetical protein|nr:hypothetical protein [Bacteriovoracaceae bacterium]